MQSPGGDRHVDLTTVSCFFVGTIRESIVFCNNNKLNSEVSLFIQVVQRFNQPIYLWSFHINQFPMFQDESKGLPNYQVKPKVFPI